MKKLISFQAGFEEVHLVRIGGDIAVVIGDVDAPSLKKVMFNVEQLTRRGLTVYGSFLGTHQVFHISAKHFDYQAVKAVIEATRETDEE